MNLSATPRRVGGSRFAPGLLAVLIIAATPTPVLSETWKTVAWENQWFSVSGTQTVRYGANDAWITKTVTGSVPCTSSFFGRDPAWGIGKQCQVGSGGTTTTTTTTTTTATTGTAWKTVAWENQAFSVSGTQTVRYGIDNDWVTKTVSGSAQCSNAFFGRDPAVGRGKQCQAGGTTTTTATAPTTSPTTTSPTTATAGTPVSYDASRIPPRAAGFSTERIQYTGQMGFATDVGSFRINCGYSHMAPDDPIVHPNQPGRSHLHTFFGNTGVNASSTADSIANTGASTCLGGTANRSAYWVPTMIDTRTGTPLKPEMSMFYYKTGYNGVRPWQVRPFPAGLRMIAGDSSNARPEGPTKFVCVGGGAEWMTGHEIQNCPAGSQLWQLIYFPQCWDGVNLDSPDHKSHMSYPVNGSCPQTHPVPLPEVSFNVIYKVTETNAPRSWRLSSDTYDRSLPGGYSSHADWFNGWKSELMRTFVERCDQSSVDCYANLLGDGRLLW